MGERANLYNCRMKKKTSGGPIAEVTASSITGFVAQSIALAGNTAIPVIERPRFGSFLKVDSSESGLEIFAVVHDVVTGSPDSVHRPSALGLTREQLKVEQPHIFSLLKTEVHAVIVGYREDRQTFQFLPPLPPEVHDFVFTAQQDEIADLTTEFEFLRPVAAVAGIPAEELLAATIREAARSRSNQYAYLVEAGQALSQIMRNDYDRLVSVLRKIRPQKVK